jgi:DNA polymerase-3 subunit delta
LKDWQKGDAQMVVIGGALKPTSKIRKAFEAHANAWAIAIYDEPPSKAEVEAALAKVGMGDLSPEASLAIFDLSKALDPGDFHQFLEKLSLFCMTQAGPVTIGSVELCAPQSTEADLDDVIGLVADLKTNELAPVLHRVIAQGGTATGLCIAALRHFRMLHTAACDPAGAAQGIGKLRPPVYGPRRDRIQRQIGSWSRDGLERVITLLLETDLKLRSAGQTAPQMAQVERCFIRISMMGKR